MGQKKLALFVTFLVFFLSLGCGLFSGSSQTNSFGTIKVINSHIKGSDPFPGGKNLPDTREYGVCINAYPPNNPPGLNKPTFDMILAKDGETTNYSLPAGTYAIQEWQFDSEINNDPLYSPVFKNLVRPSETVALIGNQTISFGSERSLDSPGDFMEGAPINPNCKGLVRSAGGKVTITPKGPTDTPEVETKEPEAKPSDSPQPAAGNGNGPWVLTKAWGDDKEMHVSYYPGTQFNFTNGSGTTSRPFGDSNSKGTYSGKFSWTPPPATLIPGQTYKTDLAATSITSADTGCSSSHQATVLYLESNKVGEASAPSNCNNSPVSDQKTLTWKVGAGSKANETKVIITIVLDNTSGQYLYRYEYTWNP